MKSVERRKPYDPVLRNTTWYIYQVFREIAKQRNTLIILHSQLNYSSQRFYQYNGDYFSLYIDNISMLPCLFVPMLLKLNLNRKSSSLYWYIRRRLYRNQPVINFKTIHCANRKSRKILNLLHCLFNLNYIICKRYQLQKLINRTCASCFSNSGPVTDYFLIKGLSSHLSKLKGVFAKNERGIGLRRKISAFNCY